MPARNPAPRHPALIVLALLLIIETLAMVVLVVVLVIDLLTQQATSVSSALALTVLVGLGALGIGAVTVGMLRRAPWSRGAAVFWQLIQLAIAIGAFQGMFAQPGIGWAITIPSVVTLALLLSRPVTVALRRDDPEYPLQNAPRP